MVGFNNIENYVVEIDQFQLKWRFTEEEYNVLPTEHLEQLKPLDKEAAKFLDKFIANTNLHDDVPFKKGFFKTEEWIEYKIDGEEEIKKWLYQRGFPFDKKVFLSWGSESAMIAPWKLVVKYFDDFFYGMSDDLTLFDETLNWAILFFHESQVYFGTNEKYEIREK